MMLWPHTLFIDCFCDGVPFTLILIDSGTGTLHSWREHIDILSKVYFLILIFWNTATVQAEEIIFNVTFHLKHAIAVSLANAMGTKWNSLILKLLKLLTTEMHVWGMNLAVGTLFWISCCFAGAAFVFITDEADVDDKLLPQSECSCHTATNPYGHYIVSYQTGWGRHGNRWVVRQPMPAFPLIEPFF